MQLRPRILTKSLTNKSKMKSLLQLNQNLKEDKPESSFRLPWQRRILLLLTKAKKILRNQQMINKEIFTLSLKPKLKHSYPRKLSSQLLTKHKISPKDWPNRSERKLRVS